MIKVTVMYPYSEDAQFDRAYYETKHLPMLLQLLAPACQGVSLDYGMSGGMPGSKPTYLAMAHMLFESPEAFFGAFGPHAENIMADIPNYTSIPAMMQISEVKIK